MVWGYSVRVIIQIFCVCVAQDDERDRFGRLRLEKRRPPLPYKVAKALDPEIYRNVEYVCWNEGNKGGCES